MEATMEEGLGLVAQSNRLEGLRSQERVSWAIARFGKRLEMLTGLLAPTFGSIQILGHTLTGDSADLGVKRRVGVVPEDLALYDHLTSREYLFPSSVVSTASRKTRCACGLIPC